MRDLGNGQFEIRNKTTGETKVVGANDLPNYGLKAPFTTTAIAEPKKTFGQKLNEVPIIGPILGTISSAATGNVGKTFTDEASRIAQEAQKKSRELAIAARTELDPETKKKMLAESKRISLQAGDAMDKYSAAINNGMVDFGTNKSPTGVVETLKTYGPQSIKTGVAAGEVAGLIDTASLIKNIVTSPTAKQLMAQKGLQKLNLGKAWGELATKSTEDKPFDASKLITKLGEESNKLSGADKAKFLKLVEKEALNPIANDAQVALSVRRNLKPASFLKKAIFGESINEKFKLAKYAGINEQLKLIPELARYDKYISTLSKVTKVAKPVIYAEVIDRILGGKASGAVKALVQ